MIALGRFATEATGGDPDDALAALAELEKKTAGGAVHDEELALAAALARVAWPPAVADPSAIEAALKDLERSGPDAKIFAAAERVRLAREGDPEGIAAAAKSWFDVGGSVPAALEWLAGAMATGEADREVAARVALAETVKGAAGTQLHAGVAMTRFLRDGGDIPFARGTSPAVRLTNLELSPPGCDPRRRTAALLQLDGALGDEPRYDALGLAGWSMLATGDAEGALATFTKVTTHRPSDLAAWEGLRSAADACDQK